MASQYTKPYLDANIYIWTIVGPTEDPKNAHKHPISRDILELAEHGYFSLYASTFIETEVVKAPGEPALSPKQEQVISGFFERNFFVWLEVDRLIAQKARQLVRDHGWKPPDAVHVATALRGLVSIPQRAVLAVERLAEHGEAETGVDSHTRPQHGKEDATP